MKKFLISAALAVISGGISMLAQNDVHKAIGNAAAQIAASPDIKEVVVKPSYWKKAVITDIGFTNTMLSSWAAGGYNTVTLKAAIDANANYSKDLLSWSNRLQAEYGFLYSSDKKGLLQQSNDRIYLESKCAYRTSKKSKWSFTAAFDFRSQFSNGYKYNTPSGGQSWIEAATLKSGALSPGYTNIALGIDFKPKDWLSVNIAPLTGGFTICTHEDLRKSYGMELRDDSLDPGTGSNYRSSLFQFGAQIKTDFKLTINNVVKYETQLVLFSDYLHNPKNLRVNWDNQISWQMAKYFKIGFKTWLIYDPKVLIASESHPEGVEAIQFKEYLALNFTYTFNFRNR